MKTVSAKELRMHLESVLDHALAGEEVIIKHRFKPPVRLTSVRPKKEDKKVLAGLRVFDNAVKMPSPFPGNKSIKQLYRASVTKKYTA